MSDPFIGEIRMFGGNFPPAGWVFCEGQLMPISENDALFTLIGTTYGGDGQETFGIPDLRGRVPVHSGTSGGTRTTVIPSPEAGNGPAATSTPRALSRSRKARCAARSGRAAPGAAVCESTSHTGSPDAIEPGSSAA